MTVTADEKSALLSMVGEFASRVVAPRVAAYDADEHIPPDILDAMASLGMFGGTVPVEWAGAGLDHQTFAETIETISRVDHCLGVLMSMPSALVGSGLVSHGTDEQRERWLVPLASGQIFGCAGVTEPQSGSNVAAMQTTYTRDGEDYVITGTKMWITNLDIASFAVTFASRDRSLGRRGVTAFIVPMNAPGVCATPFTNKLGFRPLCSGELVFDEVRLGPEHVLGAEGDGYRVAMSAVERGRLAVAARAVGLAQGCLDDSVRYAKERVIAGVAIGEHQLIQSKIAVMATEIEAARLLVRKCAEEMDAGLHARASASMAKMFASDVAQRAATQAVQIHGAYGVSSEYRVGRAYRDAKVFQIVEGTNEIHQTLIARSLLGPHAAGSPGSPAARAGGPAR